MKRVVVVGGGVTGLAVAHALVSSDRQKELAVTLVEEARTLGGNIVTERAGELLIDGGPDSWVATKPHATALAKRLGLESDLVATRPEFRRVYIAYDGKLHPMPEGVVLGVPTKFEALSATRLFSAAGTLRAMAELAIPRRTSDDDESIAAFIERRFGREVCERLAAPLLSGIHAGDASRLSMLATFPQFVEAERAHGSVAIGMQKMRAKHAASGPPPSAFLSLRFGMAQLVDALAASLGETDVRRGSRASSIARDASGGYVVRLESGETIAADDVVVTAPAYGAARIVRELDESVATLLSEIRYVSSATVFLSYARADVTHPLDATGFISARGGTNRLLAATWVTSKWPERAPKSTVLMRVFFGGALDEAILERDDSELIALAESELTELIGPLRNRAFSRVYRFDRKSPQPEVGHLARMERIHERLASFQGLHIAGNGYDGVGIPDSIKQAELVAARILGSLDVSAR